MQEPGARAALGEAPGVSRVSPGELQNPAPSSDTLPT